ncbi:MAG: protein-glutamate methylesterase/protein-glutamine glutaminase [Acidimicrobiales bacterium]
MRVLVVDDSPLVRRLVREALSADPAVEVVATAASGPAALALLAEHELDLVTLDIEMPGMSGLETLAAMRERAPRMPVIMFSTLTRRGASETLEALALGAADYVTKPTGAGSPARAKELVAESLLPRIKALCGRARLVARSPLPPGGDATASAARPQPAPRSGPAPGVEVVGVAVSTGGPAALEVLLGALPGSLPVPVLVVQHMPPMFTKLLADRLDRCSALSVVEAEDGMAIVPGGAWLAPGDRHLAVVRKGGRTLVSLHDGPPENSCRPSADVLLRSLSGHFGAAVLGVVMTGMGRDGLRGSEAVRAAGGRVLCQDEASSVVWGMPGLVANAGLAEEVLPLGSLAPAIQARTARAGRAGVRHPEMAAVRDRPR